MAENAFQEVWTEKYRPQKLEDVVGQTEIVSRLKSFVENKTLQNLLFAGPAGTGKTTCAIAIARELFGEEWRGNFLELNASDERGIDVIRVKVKDFARTRPIGEVPYKVIYLDESDALTREAQQALRRTMEDYTATCRFILACNYNSKIIDPIKSRCAFFRFLPVSNDDIKARLHMIAEKESIKISDDGMEAALEISGGDLRQAINLLQSTAATVKQINSDAVYKVAAKARPQEIEECFKMAFDGKFNDARSQLDGVMIKQGLSGEDVVRQMHQAVLKMDLPEGKLVPLLDKIGEYNFRIIEGADARIQVVALLAQIYAIGKK
ncbi:MAG: replication factor C small subunit [archaeon]